MPFASCPEFPSSLDGSHRPGSGKGIPMESAQLEIGMVVENTTPISPPTQTEQIGSARYESAPVSSAPQQKEISENHDLQDKSTPASVSNCYVFKSRLQEYCQKAGVTTPVYETIKEGPSHEPSFRSTVVVNNVRYDSLPGFFNRKAAEQSAAEVALLEISKSVDTKFGISIPVHETGLCKNLLQEYAQKMNFAIPLYECQKDEKRGRMPMYSCVVEIGGIKYIGAAASTKKEAEIKAARTALLAIQSSGSISTAENSCVYTVIPQKKKVSDLGISTQETAAALKPKKGRFKKKQQQRKKHLAVKRDPNTGSVGGINAMPPPNETSVGGSEIDTSVGEAVGAAVEMDGVCVGAGGEE